jgi:hypothetical protein
MFSCVGLHLHHVEIQIQFEQVEKHTTIGRRINPMNGFGTLYRSANSSMEATTVIGNVLGYAGFGQT